MTVTLSPETEARLRAQAAKLGQPVDALADVLLASVLTDEPEISTEEMALIDAGIQRGDAEFAAGKYRSLETLTADKKDQFGLDL